MAGVNRENPINRVKCVVNSCEYWENGNNCLASQIEIRPPQAQETHETDCATFIRKG